MNTTIKLLAVLCFLFYSTNGLSQKSIKEYVEKTSVEKIKKTILMDAFTVPATQKSFKDGHGKNPYFSSKEQLPDTIALITFHITDLGSSESYEAGNYRYTTYYWVSEKGGNMIANEIQKETLESLRAEFKKRGAVLLTPSEFLDTPEKIAFYNNEFTPEVSKMGKFLSNLENKDKEVLDWIEKMLKENNIRLETSYNDNQVMLCECYKEHKETHSDNIRDLILKAKGEQQ